MNISYGDVTERLNSLGYIVSDNDVVLIQFAINGTEQYIKNFCNITAIPPELYYVAVDMVAGTFLKTKTSMGIAIWEDIDFDEGRINSITEGDVSVSYSYDSNTSVSARFNELINRLCNRDNELINFRKLRW